MYFLNYLFSFDWFYTFLEIFNNNEPKPLLLGPIQTIYYKSCDPMKMYIRNDMEDVKFLKIHSTKMSERFISKIMSENVLKSEDIETLRDVIHNIEGCNMVKICHEDYGTRNYKYQSYKDALLKFVNLLVKFPKGTLNDGYLLQLKNNISLNLKNSDIEDYFAENKGSFYFCLVKRVESNLVFFRIDILPDKKTVNYYACHLLIN